MCSVMGLDRLLAALRRAQRAFAERDATAARSALGEAFVGIGEAFASIDPAGSPELTPHVLQALETCLRYVAEAREGRTESVDAAIALLFPMRLAAA